MLLLLGFLNTNMSWALFQSTLVFLIFESELTKNQTRDLICIDLDYLSKYHHVG